VSNEGLIVVGVDGSEPAREALEFALQEAARRSARVRAVIAFHGLESVPVAYGMASGMVVPPSTEELREDAERTIEQAVAEVTADAQGAAASVPVEVRVVEGQAAKVLREQAAGADLLVVGHRGRGGFASVCLGSVGLQCVLHAAGPVTVVRPASAAAPTEMAAASAASGEPAG
jgi:nucleotide-binding universal stress UspA family protein